MTLTGRHFRSCLEAKRAQDKFLEMWPEACGTCSAHGYHYYPGNWTTPPDVELCAFCLEDDMCPRCGERELEFVESEERHVDYSRCRACGWNELVISGKVEEDPIEGESAEDMVMPIWECFCEMEIHQAEAEGIDPEEWGEIVEVSGSNRECAGPDCNNQAGLFKYCSARCAKDVQPSEK